MQNQKCISINTIALQWDKQALFGDSDINLPLTLTSVLFQTNILT